MPLDSGILPPLHPVWDAGIQCQESHAADELRKGAKRLGSSKAGPWRHSLRPSLQKRPCLSHPWSRRRDFPSRRASPETPSRRGRRSHGSRPSPGHHAFVSIDVAQGPRIAACHPCATYPSLGPRLRPRHADIATPGRPWHPIYPSSAATRLQDCNAMRSRRPAQPNRDQGVIEPRPALCARSGSTASMRVHWASCRRPPISGRSRDSCSTPPQRPPD